jgi:hypothetical protein|tara:strand:- start:165 stop:350 length:186 start_codon:yes stop_codon:yes gene_type:complete
MPNPATSPLFDSVPPDIFNFYPKGKVDGRKVAEFLQYKNEDVSVSSGVPPQSIRYDKRMPD